MTERHHSVFFRYLCRNPLNNFWIYVFEIICRSARDIELLAQEIGKFLFGEIAQFNQVSTQAATHHDLAFENVCQLGLTDFRSLNQMFALTARPIGLSARRPVSDSIVHQIRISVKDGQKADALLTDFPPALNGGLRKRRKTIC
jgi:hypothetical protein